RPWSSAAANSRRRITAPAVMLWKFGIGLGGLFCILGRAEILRSKNPDMPGQIHSSPSVATRRRDFFLAALCLAVMLGLLFHKSFESDQILFSNDGPLGAVRAQ